MKQLLSGKIFLFLLFSCGHICRKHPCPVHPGHQTPNDSISHYDSVYNAHPNHRRRAPKYPEIVTHPVPNYDPVDLETVKQADYINHKQPKPPIVREVGQYTPPKDDSSCKSTYDTAFQPSKGTAAKLARPPTEMPRPRPPTSMITTHMDKFPRWELPNRYRFTEPPSTPFFQGRYEPISTHQKDFNVGAFKGRPSTSCKVAEEPYSGTAPFQDITTHQDSYKYRGLPDTPIAHRHRKQPYVPGSGKPMSSLTQYGYAHHARPQEGRRGICTPCPDSLNLMAGPMEPLNTEHRDMYQSHDARPSTSFKPAEVLRQTDKPFDGMTTHKLHFDSELKGKPACMERPPTQTRDRGEMDLRTTHGEHFGRKTVRARFRRGDPNETLLHTDPTQKFTGMTTNARDFVNYGPNAAPATPVKALDRQFGGKSAQGEFRGTPTYTRHYTKKPINLVCPAALIPAGGHLADVGERTQAKNSRYWL